MLRSYAELRQEAAELLEELAAVAEAARQPAVAEAARGRRRRLQAGEVVVAVVSGFSNGKSTLVNALLGRDLLPVHDRPLTATVIRVAHGPEPAVEVHFRDGRPPLAAGAADWEHLLRRFATTASPDAQAVAEVRVRHPLPLLARGLVLLDTPGLESIHDAHERITRQALAQADAVLVLVEAGKVGRAADLRLVQHLRFLRQEAVFFALNKADQLASPAAVAEAVADLRALLATVFPTPRIYPLSALYALQARLLRAGQVRPEHLAGDRRLAVPDGDGFRPVREAADADALEAASGIAALERDLEAYLVGGESVRDALLGAGVHVAARLTETVLPDLRRLRAALSSPAEAAGLAARLERCRAEAAAARARLDDLLAPGGRLAALGDAIWAAAVERRLTPAALERLVATLEGTGDGRAAAALDYALRRLCAEVAEDLRHRWEEAARDLALAAAAQVRAALARLPLPPPPPAAAPPPRLADGAPPRPGLLLAAALDTLRHLRERARLREQAGAAVAQGRRLLGELHARYREEVRRCLEREAREELAAVEATIATLEEAAAARERHAARQEDLAALERRALALLDRAKAFLARCDRQAPAAS